MLGPNVAIIFNHDGLMISQHKSTDRRHWQLLDFVLLRQLRQKSLDNYKYNMAANQLGKRDLLKYPPGH